MFLLFKIHGQELERTDKQLVADGSVDFLKCKFYFETVQGKEEWESLEKYVLFITAFDETIPVKMEKNNIVQVPESVLTGSNFFTLSVFGRNDKGKRVTTNLVQINSERSGFEEWSPEPIPPVPEKRYDYYLKVLNYVDGSEIKDAIVKINNKTVYYDTFSGYYVEKGLVNGVYECSISHEGFEPKTYTLTMQNKDIYQTIRLTEISPEPEPQNIKIKITKPDGERITDAFVSVDGETITYKDEGYSLETITGTHNIKILKEEYFEISKQFQVEKGKTVYNFQLTSIPKYIVNITNTNSFKDCAVRLVNESTGLSYVAPYTNDKYITLVPEGSYTLIAEKNPYTPYKYNHIEIKQAQNLEFSLNNFDIILYEEKGVEDIQVSVDGKLPLKILDTSYLFQNINIGEHTIVANKTGYETYTNKINVDSENVVFPFTLPHSDKYTARLSVKNDMGEFLTNANVKIDDKPVSIVDGFFEVSDLNKGYHDLYIQCNGYSVYSEKIEINEDWEKEIILQVLDPATLKINNTDKDIQLFNVYLNNIKITTFNEEGVLVAKLKKGEYDLLITCPPYTDYTNTINLEEDMTINFNFDGLDVTIQETKNISNITCKLDDKSPYKVSDGNYYFRNVQEGRLKFEGSLVGYDDYIDYLEVTPHNNLFSFEMKPISTQYNVTVSLYDEETHEQIQGAEVKIGETILTDEDHFGTYTGKVKEGDYLVTISKEGYATHKEGLVVKNDLTTEYYLHESFTLKFKVKAGETYTSNSIVRLNNKDIPYNDDEEAYVIEAHKGTYSLLISEKGYEIVQGILEVDKSREYPYSLTKAADVTVTVKPIDDELAVFARLFLDNVPKFHYEPETQTFVEENVPVGIYKLKYGRLPLSSVEKEIIVEEDLTVDLPVPELYDFMVREKNGLSDVNIRLGDKKPDRISSDGVYLFKKIGVGFYQLNATKEGCQPVTQTVNINSLSLETEIEVIPIIPIVKLKCKDNNDYVHEDDMRVLLSNDNQTYNAIYSDEENCFIIKDVLAGDYLFTAESSSFTKVKKQVTITNTSFVFEINMNGFNVIVSEENRLNDCEITIGDFYPIMEDNAGNYYFENIPLGNYTLTADRAGYNKKEKEIHVDKDYRNFIIELSKDTDFSVQDIMIELVQNHGRYTDALVTSDSFTAYYSDGFYMAKEVSEGQHKIIITFENTRLVRFIDVDEDTTRFRFDIDDRLVTFVGLRDCDITLNDVKPARIKLKSTDINADAYYTFDKGRVGKNVLKVKKAQYQQLTQEYNVSVDDEILEFHLEQVFKPENEDVSVISLDDFTDANVKIDDKLLHRNEENVYIGKDISVGLHNLTVSKRGYYSLSKSINVSDVNKNFYFSLIQEGGDTNLYPITVKVTDDLVADVYVDNIHAAYNSSDKEYLLYNISVGKHFLEVFKEGYKYKSEIINVDSLHQNFSVSLEEAKKYRLSLINYDGLKNITVKLNDNVILPQMDGTYVVEDLIADQYIITVTKEGYIPFNQSIVLLEDTELHFSLEEEPSPDDKVPVHIVPLFQDGRTMSKISIISGSSFNQYFDEPDNTFMKVYIDGVQTEYRPDEKYGVSDSDLGSYYAEVTDKQHHTVIVNLDYNKVPSKLKNNRLPTREIIYVDSKNNPNGLYTVGLITRSLSSENSFTPFTDTEFKIEGVTVTPYMKFVSTDNFSDCDVFVDGVHIPYNANYEAYILYNGFCDKCKGLLTVEKEGYKRLEQEFHFIGTPVNFTLEPSSPFMGKKLVIRSGVKGFSNAKVYLDNSMLIYDRKEKGFVNRNSKAGTHRLTVILDGYMPYYKFIDINFIDLIDEINFKTRQIEEIKLVPYKKYETSNVKLELSNIHKDGEAYLVRANSQGIFNWYEPIDLELNITHSSWIALSFLSSTTYYQASSVLLGFYYLMMKVGGYYPIFKKLLVNTNEVVEKVSLSKHKPSFVNVCWRFKIVNENGNIIPDANVEVTENDTGIVFKGEYIDGVYKVFNVNMILDDFVPPHFYKLKISKEGYKTIEGNIFLELGGNDNVYTLKKQ